MERYCGLVLVCVGIAAAFFVISVLLKNWRQGPIAKLRQFTEEFKVWRNEKFRLHQETKEITGNNIWHSSNNFLVTYIAETGFSPFLGDDDCQEAIKFLIAQGVPRENITKIEE